MTDDHFLWKRDDLPISKVRWEERNVVVVEFLVDIGVGEYRSAGDPHLF